ncbi:uncharacterized protein LACBIDRAFT_308413 [Laccaria bicolor S238N-H82]|uniref:Predicted protein n=1 Tax=Laccaria bicolor (strain S238N-H82 / ATCC MYA-4686) TaxID=486041 RepID=B0CW88_LACBS|nr:uncharacterized protein LACBIDRAFT_308413 [Laccaria bicolor S238N-H82]EDR13466.1 predicted protein [Laccaria bicolor S238N-H82]|eukprot:XP_001875964.1 predicted protein [Laccaria bicolor S238N-H82]
MGSEHKHLQMQNELLNRLNGEIRAMDGEIMSEETGLGDFKRSTIRVVMGLKFGGLVECCEKGVIIGEYRKLVTAEIPEETTQPGAPQSLYYGHTKTKSLLIEATRALSDVQLSRSLPSPMSSGGFRWIPSGMLEFHGIPMETSWLEPQPFWFPIPWKFQWNPMESSGNGWNLGASRNSFHRNPLEFQPDSMEFQWKVYSSQIPTDSNEFQYLLLLL